MMRHEPTGQCHIGQRAMLSFRRLLDNIELSRAIVMDVIMAKTFLDESQLVQGQPPHVNSRWFMVFINGVLIVLVSCTIDMMHVLYSVCQSNLPQRCQ